MQPLCQLLKEHVRDKSMRVFTLQIEISRGGKNKELLFKVQLFKKTLIYKICAKRQIKIMTQS